MIKDGYCKHFSGLLNEKCLRGRDYKGFSNDGTEFGLMKKMPCKKSNEVNTCDEREFPTKEEAQEHKRRQSQWVQNFNKAIELIQKKHKVDIEWENPSNKNKTVQGTIECPVCKGDLNYSVSSYNGHIWGKCKTEDCLNWMM